MASRDSFGRRGFEMNEAAVPTYTKKAIKVRFYYRCSLECRIFFFPFLSLLSFFLLFWFFLFLFLFYFLNLYKIANYLFMS